MAMRADWTKRADYIRARHSVAVSEADEAINDPDAVWSIDPATVSGYGHRVIGYSRSAEALLTVILIDPAADPDEQPDGEWWGSNAWRASTRDHRKYQEAQST